MSDRSVGRSLVPVAILALVWGANWPILKLGVAELGPLTFRALTLPFAGLGLLAIAKVSGESVRIPRAMWPLVGLLELFNITGWNGLGATRDWPLLEFLSRSPYRDRIS